MNRVEVVNPGGVTDTSLGVVSVWEVGVTGRGPLGTLSCLSVSPGAKSEQVLDWEHCRGSALGCPCVKEDSVLLIVVQCDMAGCIGVEST